MKNLHGNLVFFTLTLTTCFILLYFFTPYKEQMMGAVLGLWVGCYNVWFIGKKLQRVEERMVAQKSKTHGTGVLHRFSMVALAVMLAYKYPHYFDARTIVIGLPLCYFFLFIGQWFEMRREEVSLRKG